MIARIESLSRTRDGKPMLSVSGGEELEELFDTWKGKLVEIKPRRPRRSLDQNGYAWTLIDKLAAKLGRSKIEIYREAIRGIGGVSDTVCVQEIAVQNLIDGWEHNGLGWFAETFPSKIKGCVNVTLYYGSSKYDSTQMSALIDHLVQDCKAVGGIETMTPQQIAALDNVREVIR